MALMISLAQIERTSSDTWTITVTLPPDKLTEAKEQSDLQFFILDQIFNTINLHHVNPYLARGVWEIDYEV
jgi:hypothetical protein